MIDDGCDSMKAKSRTDQSSFRFELVVNLPA